MAVEPKFGKLLRKVGDSNEAKESHFKDIVARIDTNEEVGSQRGDPVFNLKVEPAEILPFQKHQGGQLLVNFLRESLDGQLRHISLDETQEGV